MADLIDRKELLQKIWKQGQEYSIPYSQTSYAEVMVGVAPAVDAVPVVRCRDCKYFNLHTYECENEYVATDHEDGASFSINFGPDDFCSYGERRGKDDET